MKALIIGDSFICTFSILPILTSYICTRDTLKERATVMTIGKLCIKLELELMSRSTYSLVSPMGYVGVPYLFHVQLI